MDGHTDIHTNEGDSKGPSTDGGETKNNLFCSAFWPKKATFGQFLAKMVKRIKKNLEHFS